MNDQENLIVSLTEEEGKCVLRHDQPVMNAEDYKMLDNDILTTGARVITSDEKSRATIKSIIDGRFNIMEASYEDMIAIVGLMYICSLSSIVETKSENMDE